MRESIDGFYIAQQDLELRGAGEVLGTKQTGLQRLRIANLMRDRHLLPQVQCAAKEILQHYPTIISDLKQRWIGEKEEFAKV
jgi:ATP-dependent DNA helicase RecG